VHNQPLTRASLPATVRAYPTLLNAATKAKQASAMRVYLLLRAYDEAGRGVIDIGDVRSLLTAKTSPWRVFGWRRGRQILNAGEGVFWRRTNADTLYLNSPARIIDGLGCGRLRGMPVDLKVKSLVGSMELVRAHFYTSFESGRPGDKPLSYAALADITGVSIRSQTTYNKLLKRKTRSNIVNTGLPYNHENIYALSQKYNRSIFCFTDYNGIQTDKAGAKTCAYRIADTRNRIHTQAPTKGRTSKNNRKINLVKPTPTRGNSFKAVRTIHSDADAASAAYASDQTIDRTYPLESRLQPKATRRSKYQGVMIWGIYTGMAA
jgi:hypothetical protein